MKRMVATHDRRPTTKDVGETFLHCAKCLREKPARYSPREWARLSVALTKTGGIQVYCVRHGLNVVVMEFSLEDMPRTPRTRRAPRSTDSPAESKA